MVAGLNSLHISPDYKQSASGSGDLMHQLEEIANSHNSKLSPIELDIEEKLRRASRITVCEEIVRLADDPILPKAILDRYEKPCKALVLWQPTKKIAELVGPRRSRDEQDPSSEDSMDDNDMSNNNNGESIDLNYDASMDLDSDL